MSDAAMMGENERERPAFEDIFTHKMTMPSKKASEQRDEHYPGWRIDHKSKPRFYVKGWLAALDLIEITHSREIYQYVKNGIALAKEDEGWRKYTTNISDAEPAEQQFGRLSKGKPVNFDRAGIMILTAEFILRKKENFNLRVFYDIISILPACYNIKKFNAKNWETIKQKNPGIDTKISDALGLSDHTLLDQLAQGNCVTFDLAFKIKKEIKDKSDVELGDIRPKPGKNVLGRGKAIISEEPDLT